VSLAASQPHRETAESTHRADLERAMCDIACLHILRSSHFIEQQHSQMVAFTGVRRRRGRKKAVVNGVGAHAQSHTAGSPVRTSLPPNSPSLPYLGTAAAAAADADAAVNADKNASAAAAAAADGGISGGVDSGCEGRSSRIVSVGSSSSSDNVGGSSCSGSGNAAPDSPWDGPQAVAGGDASSTDAPAAAAPTHATSTAAGGPKAPPRTATTATSSSAAAATSAAAAAASPAEVAAATLPAEAAPAAAATSAAAAAPGTGSSVTRAPWTVHELLRVRTSSGHSPPQHQQQQKSVGGVSVLDPGLEDLYNAWFCAQQREQRRFFTR